MPDTSAWSTTAANNATADPNINWQEGQLPSTVNNSARAMMAASRGTEEGPDSKYNGFEFKDFGWVPTRTGNTTFTLPADYTTALVEGRRLRLTDSATIFATVVSSSYGAGVTTVTVKTDDGSNLSSSLSKVYLSPQMPTSTSAPAIFNKDAYATTAGTSTAYTAAFTPKLTSLRNGATVRVKLDQTCGATPTLAVDGLTAKTIVKPGNVAVAAGDLTANSILSLTYDSTLDAWAVGGAPTSADKFTVYTTDQTAVAGQKLLMDCSSAAKTVTMPTSPSQGDAVFVKKVGGNTLSVAFGSNKLATPGGGYVSGTHTIDGPASGVFRFDYVGTLADTTTAVWSM